MSVLSNSCFIICTMKYECEFLKKEEKRDKDKGCMKSLLSLMVTKN